MAKYQVTLGTNQRDRLYSRAGSHTSRGPRGRGAADPRRGHRAREGRSWFIGEIIVIKVEQDPSG